MENTGGRVSYIKGEKVKVLNVNGTISNTIFTIQQDKSDRKGHVSLLDEKGKELKVNHRRIIPFSTQASACVVEVGDKYKVVCPTCGIVDTIRIVSDKYSCTHCLQSHACHWISTKPIREIIKEAKVNKPKVETMLKDKSEPIAVDLSALTSLPHCTLYTKRNIKFDHERIDVQAHVLLYDRLNENVRESRKLCFNTYNGTLGKKITKLPIEEFIDGNESARFFKVMDVAKLKDKLRREGYEERS